MHPDGDGGREGGREIPHLRAGTACEAVDPNKTYTDAARYS
jgi:hypothetical protein